MLELLAFAIIYFVVAYLYEPTKAFTWDWPLLAWRKWRGK